MAVGGIVTAARFNELKAKVKAECLRRNASGSVAAYGAATYDYTTAPVAGGVITDEHRNKNAVPINAINNTKATTTSANDVVLDNELAVMETFITAAATRAKTDRSATDCSGGCTGLCYSSCTGGCSGCGSGCADGCDGCDGCSGCGSGCADTCSGGCSGGCSSDGCTATCGMSCWAKCAASCSGSCSGGCGTGCKGDK